MQQPLISIIVPVYNVEKYLDKCVESIIRQTYENLEIILVDDDSPDNCPRMCDLWAQKDSRIKVLHIENKGVANARNTALKIAHGDYIGFVDSDDYIEKDMYEHLYNLIRANNADIAVCDYQINDDDRGEATEKLLSKLDALKIVVTGDYKFGVLWNKLYKKEMLQNIEMPDLVCSEDLVFNYYAFKNANTVAQSNLKLYHYFQNTNSTVHKKFDKSNYDAVKAREIIYNDCEKEYKDSALYGYILALFVFLNSIITFGACEDMFEGVRESILKHKKEINSSPLFSKKDKLKINLLSSGSKLYRKAFSILK